MFARCLLTLALTFGVSYAHAAAPTPKIALTIMSATVRQKAIQGATVVFQKEGKPALEGTTDAAGKVSVANDFGVDDDSVTLVVKKAGYSPFFVECPCNGLSYALSETLGQDKPEAIRIVINWGAAPQYLDLHVVYPKNHVYWDGHQQGADAVLDVRSNDAYGPATVTIQKRHAGEQYVVAAHRWGASGPGDRVLSQSRAKVAVYVGDSLIKSYHVPTKRAGALWVLFAIDGDGAFHDINNVVDIPEVSNIEPYLRQITERTTFGIPSRASSVAIAQAEELEKKGVAIFAEGKVEGAILTFQKAIDLHPTFALAYADLSKAYDKLGHPAEAQWAKRKSDELGRLKPSSGYRVPNDLITLDSSSMLAPWKHYTFSPDNLIDDNLWSSWQPNRKAAGGVGEWFKLTFKQPLEITGFEISNGFRLIDELGDLYAMNNRIQDATLQLSDGTEVPVHFEDTSAETTIALPAPKVVSWVKVKVKSIYKGSKWNDLAVSEFHALVKGD